jgi:hypothetical protein
MKRLEDIESETDKKFKENNLNQRKILAAIQDLIAQDKESSISVIGIN